MRLPNELRLFKADVIDVDSGIQNVFYIIDKTYDSAFNKFIEYANSEWYRYEYYFFEAGEDDIKDFIERHEGEQIPIGIYD